MKKIIFITTNKHKVEEVSVILRKYNISVEQLNIEYDEDKEASVEDISYKAAKFLANKLNKEIIVEDTGLFFKAYNNFPGALPKFIFNTIGFEGIFRLLKNKNREAYFKTAIGYCKPNQEPVLFIDKMYGEITKKVFCPNKNIMPYDHIFIPKESNKAIVYMSIEEKNLISQRGKVAKKLGEFLVNKNCEK